MESLSSRHPPGYGFVVSKLHLRILANPCCLFLSLSPDGKRLDDRKETACKEQKEPPYPLTVFHLLIVRAITAAVKIRLHIPTTEPYV